MNNNELTKLAELIWSNLNCIENENKTRSEQVELIKPVLLECYTDSIKKGRRQILNHFDGEIDSLRANDE